jgi:GNAT superfamily N-acetyltransferase
MQGVVAGNALGDGMRRIRTATLADAQDVAACVRSSFSHYVDRIGKSPLPMLYDYDEILAEHPVYVTCMQEQIVGVLVLKQESDGFWLDVVAVPPQFQRQGIGKQLIEFAEAQARDRGFGVINLYTNAMMVENQAIYSKLGYSLHARETVDGYDRMFFRKSLLKIP